MKQHRKIILNKILYVLVAMVGVTALLLVTNPNEVALPVLMVPFLLIGFIVYQITDLVGTLRSGSRSGVMKIIPMSISFMVVCLLLLESLHQLTWKDSLLTLGFTLMLWLYVSRADFMKKRP